MSVTVARKRADDIKNRLGGVAEHIDMVGQLVAEAFENRDWEILGYSDYATYCREEFETKLLKIEAAVRKPIAERLKAIGASKREIAAALGVDDKTIRNDLNPTAKVGNAEKSALSTGPVGNDEPPEPAGCPVIPWTKAFKDLRKLLANYTREVPADEAGNLAAIYRAEADKLDRKARAGK